MTKNTNTPKSSNVAAKAAKKTAAADAALKVAPAGTRIATKAAAKAVPTGLVRRVKREEKTPEVKSAERSAAETALLAALKVIATPARMKDVLAQLDAQKTPLSKSTIRRTARDLDDAGLISFHNEAKKGERPHWIFDRATGSKALKASVAAMTIVQGLRRRR